MPNFESPLLNMFVNDSPSSRFWKRFFRNFQAVLGLGIILLAMLVSVFCYVLMPDNSPDANEMHVSLGLLPPGTSVFFLELPSTANPNDDLFPDWLTGSSLSVKRIPVDMYFVKQGKLYWVEYGSYTADLKNQKQADLLAVCPTCDHAKSDSENLLEIREKQSSIRTFYLGSDRFGRDQLSRLMAGTRISMSVGLIAVFISLVIGVFLGSIAGFFRGRVDDVVMWFTNVVWSIPTLLLVIAITLALGKGFAQVFVAVGLTMWVEVARLVRGQIFSLREKDFVEAGRALGFGNLRIIFRHVLPNVMGPVVVIAASNFASAILLEAGLSFLGMGAQPPTPSWGMMVKESYAYIVLDAAHLAVFPGLAIMLMVLAFTWLGNGLRDALDTRSVDSR
ncbi:MAG: ABC transporter permease [Bacteroidota bacterium]